MRPNQDSLPAAWNDTVADYSRHLCVHELFEQQAAATPDAPAVYTANDTVISYGEVNRRANRLAHYLRSLGAKPETLVGICLDRTPDLIAGLLAIMKTGAAYVPLDPQYPAARLSLMVEDSGLQILLTASSFESKFESFTGTTVRLDTLSLEDDGGANCPSAATSEDLAYVIYTSGSTGKPKGVEIRHRSLVNFLSSMQHRPGLEPGDKVLALTTVCFDIAALEIYLPLTVGASLVLAPRAIASDGYALSELITRTAPSMMQATPATWRLLLEAGWAGDRRLKILCGGEALSRDLAAALLPRSGSLWNMYGPTETTVWSTAHRIADGDGPVLIGRPIANTQIYILDANGEPVPPGVEGELCIGGDGLARGYLKRPELTRERFVPLTMPGVEGTPVVYKTGDLARFRESGEIECLGRIDNQVKIRGFRIELGEIESALAECPAIRQSVVVAREDAGGDKRLIAYVVTAQPDINLDDVRTRLKQRLPEYMVPSQFAVLDQLPLTPNGKVDRNALPAPERAMPALQPKADDRATDKIETQLADIWSSVLGISAVGVHDNFFDLGGHSLLVAKLLRRIEQTFGERLSTALIFEAPTIPQQAATLRNGGTRPRLSAIVPVQPAGSKKPLFFCGFGAGPVFLPLAKRLGSEQPLLGVDPTLLSLDELPANCDMRGLAACLVRQIRATHPHGPYHLAGFCGGGLVAFEIACQLQAQGERVALLALLEPHTADDNAYVANSPRSGFARLGERVRFHVGNLRHIWSAAEANAYIRDHIRERFRIYSRSLRRRVRRLLHVADSEVAEPTVRNARDAVDAAYSRYQPRPFAGEVVLFQATHREPGGDWERDYWAALSGGLHVHQVPGYSNWLVRFFTEPVVSILAAKLEPYLNGRSASEPVSGPNRLFAMPSEV